MLFMWRPGGANTVRMGDALRPVEVEADCASSTITKERH